MSERFEQASFNTETSPESLELKALRDRVMKKMGDLPFVMAMGDYVRRIMEGYGERARDFVAFHVLGGSSMITRNEFDFPGDDSVAHFLRELDEKSEAGS